MWMTTPQSLALFDSILIRFSIASLFFCFCQLYNCFEREFNPFLQLRIICPFLMLLIPKKICQSKYSHSFLILFSILNPRAKTYKKQGKSRIFMKNGELK